MNILFLDSIEAGTYGGMEEWIRIVADGLANRGHRVTVAGRPGSAFLRRVGETTRGVETLEIELSGDFNPATISRLKKFIRTQGTDLISVNFNKDVRLGGLAARLDGRPRVVWSVGLDITKDSFVHKLLTPRLVDRVVVPSESLKTQITRLGYIKPEMVEVVPIGIGDKQFTRPDPNAARSLREQFELPPDAVVAVTVGRFVEQKGHRYLVDAARTIENSLPHLRFVLLGDGPLEDELRAQIDTAGVGDRFVFAGMLDNIDPVLAGADLMIHPSIEEPFGIAVLEGMRAGLPVIASRVGGIPEVVEESATATLVPPGDTSVLAAAVTNLLADPARMKRMGEAGRERWRTHFRLDDMLDRIEQIFRSTVAAAGVADG